MRRWRGTTAIQRCATAWPPWCRIRLGSTSEAAVWLPALAERNGALTIAHGSHQEIGWERQTDASGVSVLLYADHIENPVLEAQGHFAPGKAPAAVLFDRASNLMRAAGPAYGSHGVQASVERRLPGGKPRSLQLCQRQCPGDAGAAASHGTCLKCWLPRAPVARRLSRFHSRARWMAPELNGAPATHGSPTMP